MTKKLSPLTEYNRFNFITKGLRNMILKVYCSFNILFLIDFYFFEISLKLFDLFKKYIIVQFLNNAAEIS